MVPSDRLTVDQFWARAGQSVETPGTAAPSPGAFETVFQGLVSSGYDVVCFTLPRRYSGTFNAAWVAAKEFGERVRIVDSGSISLGMGLQVLQAAREALAGWGADSIQQTAETIAERTSVVFVLDTLDWVRRGGRLDRLMPLIEKVTQALRVKPVLELTHGAAYTRGCETATDLVVRLASSLDWVSDDIMLTEAGPVFAAHAGPNALGAMIIRS
jgi:DegV family protein with EDD domain